MKFGKLSAIFISIVLAATSVVMPVSADEKSEEKPVFNASAITCEWDEEDGTITMVDEDGELITIKGLSSAEEAAVSSDATVKAVVSGKYEQTEARKLLTEINRFRQSADDAWYWNSDNTTKTICSNLGELTYDYGLEQAAMKRAAEVAISFAHERPNGENCFSAYDEYDLQVLGRGENLATGTAWAYSYDVLLEMLKETDEYYSGQGHRRNLLHSGFTAIGMAGINYRGVNYLVQEFGGTGTGVAETAAVDANCDVSVEILADKITDEMLLPQSNALTLKVGEKAELPEVIHIVQVESAWPGGLLPSGTYAVCESNPAWNSNDSSIADIVLDGGSYKAKGVAAGTALCTASEAKYSGTECVTCEVGATVTDDSETGKPGDTSSSGKPGTTSSSGKPGDILPSEKPEDDESSEKTSSSSSDNDEKSSSSSSDMTESIEYSVKKVPAVAGAVFAAPTDNFSAVTAMQHIGKQTLDFSKVKTSEIPANNLCITVIKGSKFVTSVPVTDVRSWDSKAIKAKRDKITGCAIVSVKNSGAVNFTVGNEVYTVRFIVNTPKASKAYKKMPADSVIRKISMKELFGTDITGGTITATSKVFGQVTANNKDHTIVICPRQKDTVKVTYQYLNKKYKATIAIK